MFVKRLRRATVNLFRKMSTISGKYHSTETRAKEGRLNLYKGLEAIHSTLFRGCTHTRTVSNVSKCQSQSRFRILNFPQSNIIIYILLFTLSIFYFKMSLTRLTLTRLTLILSTKSGKCSKSRLVTTSAIKHFIAKVAYFYPKSGVVLPWTTYNVVETRRQGVQGVRKHLIHFSNP